MTTQIKIGNKNRKMLITVDNEDVQRIILQNWYFKPGLIYTVVNGTSVTLGRFILNYKGDKKVDHENRNIRDNTRDNLRVANESQQSMNRDSNKIGSSKFKGVSFQQSSQKWYACIQKNYISYNLGLYDTEIEAAKAYDIGALKYHREFAVLNFPLGE